MAEYEFVSKGALKLKTDTTFKKKKKKKKTIKETEKILEQVSKVGSCNNSDVAPSEKETVRVPLTKAERAYMMMKEKKQMERIMEKASKTHKQRVEEFNRHLDSLTEHYDIPKVSWTK